MTTTINDDDCQQEKVVLITGASSGIGEATAIEYAKFGNYKIAITGRNKERLEKVISELIENSPKSKQSPQDNFLSLQADFEDPSQVEPIIEQTINKFKRLDILINNAGYLGKKYEIQHAEFYEDFKHILQVNLFASVRLCQLARPYLEQSGKGVIVNVSSIADRMAMPAISYSVSKAGLSMLTKTLTNALDGTGMRVVTVSPGPVVTNITNPEYLASMGVVSTLHRAGRSKEVADTIVFLTSDKASFITGCTIDVDGGVLTKHGGMFIDHKDLIE